jgi:hypothetical protein
LLSEIFIICILKKYKLNDYVTEEEMSIACSTDGSEEK